MTSPPPNEIRLSSDRRLLTVAFADGSFSLTAELLRVESPSAEVQGHDPSEKRIVSGKRGVTIAAIEPVGNYAIRLIFDDGHDTGIYSWDVLARLARERDRLWADYLAALEAHGLAR